MGGWSGRPTVVVARRPNVNPIGDDYESGGLYCYYNYHYYYCPPTPIPPSPGTLARERRAETPFPGIGFGRPGFTVPRRNRTSGSRTSVPNTGPVINQTNYYPPAVAVKRINPTDRTAFYRVRVTLPGRVRAKKKKNDL